MAVKKKTETVVLLNNRFEKGKALGSGAFGTIYKAYDQKLKKDVALKAEAIYGSHNQLHSERRVYEAIGKIKGFLHMYDYFEEKGQRYLAFTLVGHSLENDFVLCKKKLELKSTLLIAIQLIEQIRALHLARYVHRDIKPDNMAMGLGNDASTLFILDLGLGKEFKTKDNRHHRIETGRSLVGTARYASIHSHEGVELSRRDDLESIAYVLIYLQKGELPWQGLRSDHRGSKYHQIHKKKKSISPADLCKGLEPEFCKFLEYTRKLSYAERPDYEHCLNLFRELFKKNKFEYDNIYQWTKPTDPAYIAKKKLAEEKKLKEEQEKRKKEAVLAAKRIRRRKYNPASKQELYFPLPCTPLEVKRAIIRQQMIGAQFTHMAPPLFPPRFKQEVESPVKVEVAAADDAAKAPQDANSDVDVPQAANVDAVNVPQAAAANVPQDPQAVAVNVPQAAAVDAPQDPQAVAVNIPQDPQAVAVNIPQDPQAAAVDAPQDPQAAAVNAPQDPQATAANVPQDPQAVAVNVPQAAPQGPQAAPAVNSDVDVKIPPANATQQKPGKGKKRKAKEVKLAPPPGPKKKTRAEQQAEMLAMAQAQAQEQKEARAKYESEQWNSSAFERGTCSQQFQQGARLPSFQQRQTPYRPLVTFNPTFGMPGQMYQPPNSGDAFFLF